MNLNDIQQTVNPEPSVRENVPAIVLSVTLAECLFQGSGYTLSGAMKQPLAGIDEWRDRLNEIRDEFLNERTLALKNALNDF